ncbi:protein abrupt isoform X2 [Hyalella azteca]|uniref:Protein abrupt isoform X2 n=1 Tax=Hyalella azteca TaxID=294128 RepID=A0A8B7MZ74_HYAAZ|nr:protein abrupt isoform X2 [Hyalella azteca]
MAAAESAIDSGLVSNLPNIGAKPVSETCAAASVSSSVETSDEVAAAFAAACASNSFSGDSVGPGTAPASGVAASSANSGRRTSRVWLYFSMIDNYHYACKLCQFVGTYTNTTNMRKHIQHHHPERYQDILDHTRHITRPNLQHYCPMENSQQQQLSLAGTPDLQMQYRTGERSVPVSYQNYLQIPSHLPFAHPMPFEVPEKSPAEVKPFVVGHNRFTGQLGTLANSSVAATMCNNNQSGAPKRRFDETFANKKYENTAARSSGLRGHRSNVVNVRNFSYDEQEDMRGASAESPAGPESMGMEFSARYKQFVSSHSSQVKTRINSSEGFDSLKNESQDGVVGQRSMLQDDNGELSSGGGSVGLSGIEAVVAAAAAAAAAAGDPGPAVSGASQTSTDNHMMMGGGAMTSSISSSAAAREAAIGMSPPSVTSPNKPESYQLRHNNHLSLVLNQLAEDEAFMDVTLTAEGRSVKAHKSVLSAVSPYFSAVLRANPCQHPIIIMPRDVRYAELSNIIMYIYKGEMTVSAEDLPSLLKTAELLRITGLSPGENATSSQQPLTRTTNLSSSSSTVTANSFAGLFNGSMNPTSTSYSTPPHSESSRVLGSPRHEHLLQTTPIKKSSGSCLAKATPVRIESPTPDPTMLNPSDFMDLDMTCVKEELNSEEEDEEDIPKSPSPKEVTTPPPVENPLSSDSRDRHPPDARLDQEDPDTQPNLEAASDDHDSSHLRQSSHQSSSSPAGQREDSDNEIKRSSLKTLANLASLDTPTNLSPCDDSSSSSSSSLPDTSEILPNVCPYCSEYVVGNDMSSHLSTKHAFKPAFICSECQRVFTRKNVREMHAKDCKKET